MRICHVDSTYNSGNFKQSFYRLTFVTKYRSFDLKNQSCLPYHRFCLWLPCPWICLSCQLILNRPFSPSLRTQIPQILLFVYFFLLLLLLLLLLIISLFSLSFTISTVTFSPSLLLLRPPYRSLLPLLRFHAVHSGPLLHSSVVYTCMSAFY